jgi:hypothetical protein
VTNELGEENQYENGWVVTNRDTARNIVLENSNWLEFAYEKLGAQLSLKGLDYELKDGHLEFTV